MSLSVETLKSLINIIVVFDLRGVVGVVVLFKSYIRIDLEVFKNINIAVGFLVRHSVLESYRLLC